MMRKMSKRKRLLSQTDYTLLKRQLCENPSAICLNEADLETLWSGKPAFLWESPPATSAKEAVSLARQAAAEMTPEPGWAILTAVLYVVIDSEVGLNTFEKIVDPIQQIYSKDANIILITETRDEKGIRFLLATSEKRKETQ